MNRPYDHATDNVIKFPAPVAPAGHEEAVAKTNGLPELTVINGESSASDEYEVNDPKVVRQLGEIGDKLLENPNTSKVMLGFVALSGGGVIVSQIVKHI
jgi:hypothetical protein